MDTATQPQLARVVDDGVTLYVPPVVAERLHRSGVLTLYQAPSEQHYEVTWLQIERNFGVDVRSKAKQRAWLAEQVTRALDVYALRPGDPVTWRYTEGGGSTRRPNPTRECAAYFLRAGKSRVRIEVRERRGITPCTWVSADKVTPRVPDADDAVYWTLTDSHHANTEGWDLFDAQGSAYAKPGPHGFCWQIQRDDEAGVFAYDDEALVHVTRKAGEGDATAQKALRLHRLCERKVVDPGVVVHVVAFEPKNGGATGGFDWYPTEAAAQEEYARATGSEVEAKSHDHYRFDARVSSHERATEEIDACWGSWRDFSFLTEPADVREEVE